MLRTCNALRMIARTGNKNTQLLKELCDAARKCTSSSPTQRVPCPLDSWLRRPYRKPPRARARVLQFPTSHERQAGTWCSGITSASHAEGPGFKSQCVHLCVHALSTFSSACRRIPCVACCKCDTRPICRRVSEDHSRCFDVWLFGLVV